MFNIVYIYTYKICIYNTYIECYNLFMLRAPYTFRLNEHIDKVVRKNFTSH